MAYVGRGIDNISNASILDVITFTDSAGPYNLEQGSAAFTPVSVQALVISVDGVIQSPSSYTISAATITFDSVMASTSTNDFIVHNGVGLITEPSDGSVTTAKIEDLAVTTAKLANTNVTAGKLATDAVETAKIKDLNVTAGKLAATQDLSTKTITLPATVAGLGTGIDVTSQITGVVPTANLGSGSASSSTYLAGDQTYKEIVATDIAWQAVTTGTTLTAVAGRGYPIDTTSNVCTVTLPASASVGDQIIFTDYARTWATYAVTLDQGSLKYQSQAANPVYNTDGASLHIVYMDVTQGWIPLYDGAVDYASLPAYNVEYLVVAGGGGGGHGYTGGYYAGGGGAGGYRNSYASEDSGKESATESVASVTSGVTYTLTVGGGGAYTTNGVNGVVGEDSSFIGTGVSITSAGGGYGQGGNDSTVATGGPGGCGGGAADGVNYSSSVGGLGTVAQGYDGGDGSGNAAGSGGGTGAEGTDNSGTGNVAGGAGLASSITASSVTRAVGGMGSNTTGGVTKTANTGDGGDGSSSNVITPSAGASGVVILRMLTANYSGTTTGSPTVSTDGLDTILIYTGDGTYVG